MEKIIVYGTVYNDPDIEIIYYTRNMFSGKWNSL